MHIFSRSSISFNRFNICCRLQFWLVFHSLPVYFGSDGRRRLKKYIFLLNIFHQYQCHLKISKSLCNHFFHEPHGRIVSKFMNFNFSTDKNIPSSIIKGTEDALQFENLKNCRKFHSFFSFSSSFR